MNTNKRMVNLTYAVGTILAYVIFWKAFASGFASFGIQPRHLLGQSFTVAHLLGAITALALLFWAWRHPRYRPQLGEVVDELSKVTWPTWEETKSNTWMTILVTVIISAILWIFDTVFFKLTNWILGGGGT
ncbi:MAG: preprotein translocase subunit SecE [Bradymonadia bacterium]